MGATENNQRRSASADRVTNKLVEFALWRGETWAAKHVRNDPRELAGFHLRARAAVCAAGSRAATAFDLVKFPFVGDLSPDGILAAFTSLVGELCAQGPETQVSTDGED